MPDNTNLEKYIDFIGEFIGTFILVFFGCGSVAVTVLFSSHNGLFQVTALWGIGAALAIYATRHISCAHLKDLSPRLFAYLAGWHYAAMPDNRYGFLIVYVAGPFCGASLPALLFRKIIEPIMLKKNNNNCCK